MNDQEEQKRIRSAHGGLKKKKKKLWKQLCYVFVFPVEAPQKVHF